MTGILTPGTTPVPRVRVRNELLPVPSKAWRAYHDVPDTLTKKELCTLGEIDPSRKPIDWQGWPNGSCYNGRTGYHKGRVLRTVSGKYHALRWGAFTKSYTYLRTVKTHEAALYGL